MSDPIVLSFKELAALIVRDRGIREGNWGVWVKFGIGATNIGEDVNTLLPAAIVPILELGIQEFDSESGLTVNASELWAEPAEKDSGRRASRQNDVRARAKRTRKKQPPVDR